MSVYSDQNTALEEAEQKMADYERKEGIKSVLLEEEAIRRGYAVERLTFDTMILRLADSELLFKDMNGPSSSAAIQEVCDNKYSTRSLVSKSGVTVPKSSFIPLYQTTEFIQFAEKADYPVVIKPNNLARGQGVFINIDSEKLLKQQLDELASIVENSHEKVLIEKQYMGDDYRFFVLENKLISVTKRARANVTGDGKHTILELIEKKNRLREKNRYLRDCLIPTDITELNRLEREGKLLDYVPPKDERVVLRDESNIAQGGDCIDFTDQVHPDYHEIAIKTIQSIPGLQYAGLDIIVDDISEAPTSENYVVTEVEFSPGPISMYPWKGEPRDMASPVLDFYERYVNESSVHNN